MKVGSTCHGTSWHFMHWDILRWEGATLTSVAIDLQGSKMIQVSMVWSGIFQTWRSKIIVGHRRGVTSESYQNWFTYSWSSPTLRMCTTHRWFTYAMPLCIIRHSDSKAFSQGMLNIIPQSQSKSHSSDLIILEEARAQKWIRRKLTR